MKINPLKRSFEYWTHSVLGLLWFITFCLCSIIFAWTLTDGLEKYQLVGIGLMIICLIFYGISTIKETIINQEEKVMDNLPKTLDEEIKK